jgi:hypothetical protein
VFRAKPVHLTDHEAYALAVLMHAVAGLSAEPADWLAGGLFLQSEEREALPSACQRVAECLAANGWRP